MLLSPILFVFIICLLFRDNLTLLNFNYIRDNVKLGELKLKNNIFFDKLNDLMTYLYEKLNTLDNKNKHLYYLILFGC